jgi:hypothetical protein
MLQNRAKRKTLNTLEKYHIHKISKDRLHTKDTYIDTYNPIFEAKIRGYKYI